ncbi:MAG: hypothetical protein KatS3mg031_1612 [Chitinophagales bacterium]|nr:MAG: hypothetical protein KatS3mg031_1612 [Chitinophagales bacterium]
MHLLKGILRFFPIQLLILHLKTHQIFILLWALLFLIITNNLGISYGIPYLLLDPEYLGEVGFISFAILGAAFGGFVMTWNIAIYILDAYRFPFLATFNHPFALFCLNNSLLPGVFLIAYFWIMIRFQLRQEFMLGESIVYDVSGFISGLLIIIFLAAFYFTNTNKNLYRMFGVRIRPPARITRRMRMRQNFMWEQFRTKEHEFPVEYYLTARLRIRRIRGVDHYDEKMIHSVLRQNHFNALMIELATLATLIGLGFLIDYEIFNIPAGASALLFLAILVSFSGIISFWGKGWKNTLMIGLFIALDMFYRLGGFSYDNRAYGLNYDTARSEYSLSKLKEIGSPENMEEDKQLTLSILENWKKKTGQERPKMVLIAVSGGGLSAAYFSTHVLQTADSMLQGKLLKHTAMITGSSGGMFGASYLRELYLRQQLGEIPSIYNPEYAENMGKDILNSVCFTIVVNDIFFPWQEFSLGKYTYRKDRGYAMEKQLNQNTGFVLNKPLRDYRQYEQDATIPLLIFSPTIINDERKLYISAQPVSYLMRPAIRSAQPGFMDIDGVDFMRLFEHQDADNLLLTTAIRMNGTYPYILPNVTMPTSPVIKVMDAGFRDNYGLETALRFIYVFRDWIYANTSGVVLVAVRNFRLETEIEAYHRESFVDRVVNPIANLYENLGEMHDYNHAYLINYANEWLQGKLDVVYFEYIPAGKDRETSMSLHLTSREKVEIRQNISLPHIRQSIDRLQQLLQKDSP